MAYTCICGAGPNGAILHYGHAGRPNDRYLVDGDQMVLDMGAEYSGYTTDLTRSYPINGKFSDDQKMIHNAVYAAQQAVYAAMKPGVQWTDMHRLSERVILQHLLNAGLLQNGTVDEMMAVNVASYFMPHGLGHLLGMNVHDVGGYPNGQSRSSEPGLCWVRCGRKLEQGMVLTVEPGIYFNEPWVRKALKNDQVKKFINEDVLNRFWNFGGCRLEDDIVVTENGCENLSGAWPTSVQEIEAVMANK
jgi:Xaa-Pro dipeptidase